MENGKEKWFGDVMFERAKAGQAVHLEEMLKDGIPLFYLDDDGNGIWENPDGTITPVPTPEICTP